MIETVIEIEGGWPELPALAERAVGAALGWHGLAPEACEVAVLGCDDARIAGLNADFRGKARPTNVLSWPALPNAPDAPGRRPRRVEAGVLGDIAIARGVCTAEAAERGLPLEAHLTHLLVHATLHLLGYGHDHEADADIMERTEIEILAEMGVSDPYS